MGIFSCQKCGYSYDFLEYSDKCGSAPLPGRKFNIGDVVQREDVRYKIMDIKGPFPPSELIAVADAPTTIIAGCVAIRDPLHLTRLIVNGPLSQNNCHFYVYEAVTIESGIIGNFLEEELELAK